MQFVLDGPDIPDELLQYQEDGRVVFFCGAGISYGLGLPGYEGLVSGIREQLGDVANNDEKKLEDDGRWDSALDYLEKKLSNPRQMREALVRVLTPRNVEASDYDTHRALLTLSRTRGGKNGRYDVHLVTTNFDRAFETIRPEFDWKFHAYAAPFLPIPKETTWNGIVYLHGLIPEGCGYDDDLDNLIVTSGGFGRAYLSERWASRFVSELLRNYVVCFVGYSLSDAVMRYLIDAVEANRARGESTNPVYLFLDQAELEKLPELSRNKTIIPIGFNASERYRLLHETIKGWARAYRMGSQGKVAIIDKEAQRDPNLEPNTGYQERVKWALSDRSGIPARRFCESNHIPPIGWLKVLEDTRFTVQSPETQIPGIAFDECGRETDARSAWIFDWAAQYLNHPAVIERCISCGRRLNRYFIRRVVLNVAKYGELKAAGKVEELKRIRERSPFAIPDEYAAKIWHLLILGRLLPMDEDYIDILALVGKVKSGCFDWFTANRIADCFAPRVCFKKRWGLGGKDDALCPERVFDWQLECSGARHEYFAGEIREALTSDCEILLEAMQNRLRDVLADIDYLDPCAEVGLRMICGLPSVEEHFQNGSSVYSWRCSLDIVRDSWLKIADRYPEKAKSYYLSWIHSPHCLFRRLALFVAKRTDIIPPEAWIGDVLAGHGFLLWQTFAQREICRLFVAVGKWLKQNDLDALIGAILAGPPPCMFLRLKSRRDEFQRRRDYIVWLRLAKLRESDCVLPAWARQRLDELESKYKFKCSKWQEEEFVGWHSGTGSPDYEEQKFVVHLPTDRNGLVEELTNPALVATLGKWSCEGDDFGEICQKNPEEVLSALTELCARKTWKVDRIRTALQVWRNPEFIKYACMLLRRVVMKMPESAFFDLSKEVCRWSQEVVKCQLMSADLLSEIANRIVAKHYSGGDDDSSDFGNGPIGAAINQPVGMIVEAILDFCFPKVVHKGDGIQEPWKTLLTQVCATDRTWTRHGLVILASRCVALFYADESWVCENLLPKLCWKRNSEVAVATWAGFVRVHGIHAPLMLRLKENLFSCIDYIASFADCDAKQYCALVTTMGIIGTPGYNYNEYRELFARFPMKQLESAAHCIVEIAKGRKRKKDALGDERWTVESCWQQQIKPFIRAVWPKDIALRSSVVSGEFCKLVSSLETAFPDGLKELHWLMGPLEDHFDFLYQIESDGLARDYPSDVLELLSITVKEIKWSGLELRKVLNEIAAVDTMFKDDDRYFKLNEMVSVTGY